jgi:hydrophobic/amphiphilic exporter-1 (mainly G- bacteria), HAE1 family
LNGKASAVLALYQLPGSNAIAAVDGVTKLMEEMKNNFPSDLEYSIPLDTTQSVREGIKEILHTLVEALVLVIIVVFIFLQGWRATLIPALAVPVSLIGTFAVFPLLGFSINTIALMGLVLAMGLWWTTLSWWLRRLSTISKKGFRQGKQRSRLWKRFPDQS